VAEKGPFLPHGDHIATSPTLNLAAEEGKLLFTQPQVIIWREAQNNND
jgi:hypothetical protein